MNATRPLCQCSDPMRFEDPMLHDDPMCPYVPVGDETPGETTSSANPVPDAPDSTPQPPGAS